MDEIGGLSLSAQVKLLRFLENSTFIKIGDVRETKVDIRLICATNKNLKNLITQGKFREDLFYRINIFHIYISALIVWIFYIETLSFIFLIEIKNSVKIDNEIIKLFKKYNWPGNIRELKHFIERLVIIDTDDNITIDDVPPDFYNGVTQNEIIRSDKIDDYIALKHKVVKTFDYNYFSNLLDQCAWNINKASRLSKLSRKTIYQKMEELGLKRRE